MAEQLIKSRERVRKNAEVFTPAWLVSDMLDQQGIKELCYQPDKTFMEPACGTGNFLVQILERKFSVCKSQKDYIISLSSIYGVELMQDNVDECRERLLKMCDKKVPKKLARKILQQNIAQGNFLEPDSIWLYEYRWNDKLDGLEQKRFCLGSLMCKWGKS